MFGLFSPRLPLRPWNKAWVEDRLQLLSETVGIERLMSSPLIVPDDPRLVPLWQETDPDLTPMVEVICGALQLSPAAIAEHTSADGPVEAPTHAGGNCSTGSCNTGSCGASSSSHPRNKLSAVSTELSRISVLEHGLCSPDAWDIIWTADLLLVFSGLGALHAQLQHDPSHLQAPELGYALALVHWLRFDADLSSTSRLPTEIQAEFQTAMRYLNRRGETAFAPQRTYRPQATLTVPELIERLERGSSSTRIFALWQAGRGGTEFAGAADPIAQLLAHKESDIRAEAAKALSRVGTAGEEHRYRLHDLLADRDAAVRMSAALALGGLPSDTESVEPLIAALGDNVPEVVEQAAISLCQYSDNLEETVVPAVLQALRVALVNCQDGTAALLVETLSKITPDPERQVLEYFDEQDYDLRQLALDVLAAR